MLNIPPQRIFLKLDNLSITGGKREIILTVSFSNFTLASSSSNQNGEVNLSGVKINVIPENLYPAYINKSPMGSSNMLQHIQEAAVVYTEYPIVVPGVSIYIPEKESGSVQAANKAASVGAKIVKPLTVALMIFAFPVAIALIKVLQALDFLTFININNMPTNVKFILDLVGAGSFF